MTATTGINAKYLTSADEILSKTSVKNLDFATSHDDFFFLGLFNSLLNQFSPFFLNFSNLYSKTPNQLVSGTVTGKIKIYIWVFESQSGSSTLFQTLLYLQLPLTVFKAAGGLFIYRKGLKIEELRYIRVLTLTNINYCRKIH